MPPPTSSSNQKTLTSRLIKNPTSGSFDNSSIQTLSFGACGVPSQASHQSSDSIAARSSRKSVSVASIRERLNSLIDRSWTIS